MTLIAFPLSIFPLIYADSKILDVVFCFFQYAEWDWEEFKKILSTDLKYLIYLISSPKW